jgi:hypothetical protein
MSRIARSIRLLLEGLHRYDHSVLWEEAMKLAGLILLLCLAGFFLGLGCSGDEPPPPSPKPKVVKKAIPKAPAEAAKPAAVPVEEKAGPEEKTKPEPSAKAGPESRPDPAAKAPGLPPATGTAKTDEKPKPEVPASAPEKPKPDPAAKVPEKPVPEGEPKSVEKAKPQPPAKPEKKETRVEASGPKAAPAQAQERVSRADDKKGFYSVRKGDTLASIAGRGEVYGDRLKWAILYRTNREALGSLPQGETLPDVGLPEGMQIRVLSEEEMKRNVQRRASSLWVVNALSAVTQGEVVPAVLSLVKHGYPVYITTAKVNDKDWMRLRVGFFKTRAEADEEGKKIMELLHFKDSWTTKLGANEFADFARY